MKIIPLYPKVVIERVRPEKQSQGGIILPTSQKESLQGIVVSCYENCEVIKVNQKVLYKQYAGEPIDKNFIEGKDYLIIDEEELLAIYE